MTLRIVFMGTPDFSVPTLAEILDRDPVELRITWVEIRALPELDASARA